MAAGGKRLGQVREVTARAAKPGVTTAELDAIADKMITKLGGEAAFKLVPGYHHATCICVNDEVVHGMPGPRKLLAGDVVGIDVGMVYKGWTTDTSTTVLVNIKSPMTNVKSKLRFLEVGRETLKKAIAQAKPGKRVADISRAMQEGVEQAGYSAVTALTGHGIGRHLHEEPAIPCFVVGNPSQSPIIRPGMVLAIEVMYNAGTAEVVYKNEDGWTIATADGKISGLFEETVAVTEKGPVVLTRT